MDFIKKVNSYKDICKILNIDPDLKPDVSAYHERDKDAAVSLFRLWNANRAAWGDEIIDWDNYSQRKYEIWCDLRAASGSGVGFSFIVFDYDCSGSDVGARLVWPSLAIGKHLVKILEQDFINVMKVKK